MLNAVDIDSSMKQDFIDFANNPDKDTIISFFEEFRESELVIPFLSDCLMLCACENELEDHNVQVINKLAVELGVYGEELSELYEEFSRIKKLYFDDVDETSIALHIVSYFKSEIEDLDVQQKSEEQLNEIDIILPEDVFGEMSWNNNVDGYFKEGDVLASIESGKVVLEIRSPKSGTLHKSTGEGEYCYDGEIIGQILFDSNHEI